MAFGKKYTYNPVPKTLQMLLVAPPNAGKTTFASHLVKDGKIGVVVDSDQRFNEVVTSDTEHFVPLSDASHEMLDPKKIYDITHKSMPNPQVGLFLVDSLTAIIEPIILNVQRDVEEGKSKGARGYKEKADAMKYLQAAFMPWGVDVIWVYHYRERGDASGNMSVVTSVSTLELSRIYRNINIKCEIVVDKSGKRGVKVLEARGGRTGITIWDDSGTWQNIRQRLEQEVWGGLTEQEQKELVDNVVLTSPEQAVAWAVEYAPDLFKDNQHAINSYEKLKAELLEANNGKLTAKVMYSAWQNKVKEKLQTQEKEE